MELTPIDYPKIIKFQIIVTEIDANKLFFDFLDTPSFRVYLGQKLDFVFNNVSYSGEYSYILDDTTTEIEKHYISNNDPGFDWLIPLNSVIDIYDTFSIQKTNELVTFQDIVEYFKSGEGDFKLGPGKVYETYNPDIVKPSLLNPFEKSKLNNTQFLIKFKNLITLELYDPNWNDICTLKTTLSNNNTDDGKSNTFRIIIKNTITNDIVDGNITILNNSINTVVLFKINHCSLFDDTIIQLHFVDMQFVDGIKRIKVQGRLKNSQQTNNEFEVYLGINQFDSLDNSTVGFVNESVILFDNDKTSFDVDKNLVEINNNSKSILIQSSNTIPTFISPLIYDSGTNTVAINVNAFAPYGTVSFPGFGLTHSVAAYGDHGHTEYKNSYTITLPNASTVNARCQGAIEGTDYPTGWQIKAYGGNPADLAITHNLGKRIFGVYIYSTISTGDRLLYANAAYSGLLAPDQNNLRIEGLATVSTPIVIQILFT